MACSLEAVSIGKLESLLECSICLETVKDPRTLPCYHSYCMSCLERFVKNHRENEAGRQVKDFNCPNCRRQFTLNPGEEVADMTPNHFIFNMLEVMAVQNRLKVVPCSHCQGPSVGRCITCEVFLCHECQTVHNSYRGFVNHSVLSMDDLAKPENQRKIRRKLHCEEHKKTLKFYCETCQQLICRDCTDFNHEKPEHSWLPVAKAAEKEKQHLASSCATLTQQLEEGTQLLETISNLTQSLDRKAETVKSEINRKKQDMLTTFSQILDKNTRSLLNEVDKIHTKKRSELEAQSGEVRSYVDNVKHSVQLSTGLLEKGNDEEILSSQKMIQDNAENFKKERPRSMKPVNDDKICYRGDRVDVRRFAEIANNLGKVEDGTAGEKSEKILEQSSPGNNYQVVENVLKKTHRIEGYLLGAKKYESTNQQDWQNLKKARTVWVSDIPDGATTNSLQVYFQKKRNGGGEIEGLKLSQDGREAMIVFEDPEVATAVVSKEQIIKGKVVKMKSYKDCKAPATENKISKDVRTVSVTDIPEGVTESTLHIHFQRKKIGGGEIEDVRQSPDGLQALIVFEDPEVAKEVAKREQIIKGKYVKVESYKPPEKETEQTSSELKGVVLVSDIPEGTTKSDLHIHFQKKRNAGGEINRLTLSEDGKQALIYFEEPKVVQAVVNTRHIIGGKVVKVESLDEEKKK